MYRIKWNVAHYASIAVDPIVGATNLINRLKTWSYRLFFPKPQMTTFSFFGELLISVTYSAYKEGNDDSLPSCSHVFSLDSVCGTWSGKWGKYTHIYAALCVMKSTATLYKGKTVCGQNPTNVVWDALCRMTRVCPAVFTSALWASRSWPEPKLLWLVPYTDSWAHQW